MTTEQALLRAILSTVARQVFPPSRLREIVAPLESSSKQLAAYNLCDGSRGLTEIALEVGLDKSNLHKAINRWVEQGVAFRVENGSEVRILHLYPLSDSPPRKERP
jgi:hypothetical protein